MPTYDYECQKCGKAFEVFQSMKAEPLTECEDPDCKGKVKRLIGAGSGLIFKGSGFYITDYKKGGAPPSEGGATAAEKPAASGETAPKNESKPAGQSETKSEAKAESKAEPKSGAKPAPASKE